MPSPIRGKVPTGGWGDKNITFSFSRNNRLTTKHDFQTVFASATKATHRSLIVLYRSNNLPQARLGIIVPKQHVRLAVSRHRVRRLIRESFRHHKDALKGLDIVVLIRSKCTPLDAVRNDVEYLWQKITH